MVELLARAGQRSTWLAVHGRPSRWHITAEALRGGQAVAQTTNTAAPVPAGQSEQRGRPSLTCWAGRAQPDLLGAAG